MIPEPNRMKAAELVEREAWLDMFAAAPDAVVEELELAFGRIGGIVLLASRAVPITEFNRAMAVGVEASAEAGDLDRTLEWLDGHAANGWALQLAPVGESEASLAWLAGHGMTPAGNGWAKFYLPPAPFSRPAAAEGGIEVRPTSATDANAYGEIVRSVFGFPASAGAWFAALVGRPGWSTYIAYDGETAVGSGAMFARDGAAWLGIGTTLSAFRRRGVQTALLARRIADARSEGVETLTTETGYPASDEAAFPSYRNVRRAGFALAYVRPNYKRP